MGSRSIALLALTCLVAACGEPPPTPSSAPTPLQVDRSAGERPAETLAELSLDGGDAALGALVGQLPPGTMRAALPARISTALDGLIETPPAVLGRVAADSPLRLLMAHIDGEVRSAVAVRLDEPVPAADRRPGGPRGAWLVGQSAAVDDRVAVVADDAAMLERVFGYLAYGALERAEDEGVVVVRVPSSTIATTLRPGFERMVQERRASVLASVAAARAAHDRPPDVGDPEALVGLVADALLARIGYLPDLGDATITLRPTPSGLALAMQAAITSSSPLAGALEGRVPVAASLISAMPASSAVVIATGTTAAARAETQGELAEALIGFGAERVSATERAGLARASSAVASIRGDQSALAVGASDANGLFAIGLTRAGSSAPAPMPWGRAYPWTSALVGALVGCVPRAPVATLCEGVSLATSDGEGVRADAIGRGAAELAESSRTSLARETVAASPDLARDLAALPGGAIAIAMVRPLRALPMMAALGGPPPTGLPRGDGAVLLALAHDEGVLRVVLRASTSSLADLDVVVRLFAEDADSE